MAYENAGTALGLIERQPQATKDALTKVIEELQGVKMFVATGAAAEATITVTGIGADDTLVAILQLPATGNIDDLVVIDLDEASIEAANEIELATTDTTSDKLLVIWAAKP